LGVVLTNNGLLGVSRFSICGLQQPGFKSVFHWIMGAMALFMIHDAGSRVFPHIFFAYTAFLDTLLGMLQDLVVLTVKKVSGLKDTYIPALQAIAVLIDLPRGRRRAVHNEKTVELILKVLMQLPANLAPIIFFGNLRYTLKQAHEEDIQLLLTTIEPQPLANWALHELESSTRFEAALIKEWSILMKFITGVE
jgi:hypothetical protein